MFFANRIANKYVSFHYYLIEPKFQINCHGSITINCSYHGHGLNKMVFTESIVARSVTSGLRRIVVTARVVANENQRILSTRAVDICKQSLLGDVPHEGAGLG